MNVNAAKTFEHHSKNVREAAIKDTNSKKKLLMRILTSTTTIPLLLQ